MHSKMSRQQWKEFTHPKSSLEQALLRRMKAVSRCKAAGGLTWTSSHKFSLPKHFVHTKAHLDSCIRIPLSFQLWIFSARSLSLSLQKDHQPFQLISDLQLLICDKTLRPKLFLRILRGVKCAGQHNGRNLVCLFAQCCIFLLCSSHNGRYFVSEILVRATRQNVTTKHFQIKVGQVKLALSMLSS